MTTKTKTTNEPLVKITIDARDAARIGVEQVEQVDVMLSTDDIDQILAEWLARKVGIEGPVTREVMWMWSPGRGPVANVDIQRVGKNVVPLRPVAKGTVVDTSGRKVKARGRQP